MTAYNFDSQPLLFTTHDMHGLELAVLDTLQHSLAGDPEHAHCFPPWRARRLLLSADDPVIEQAVDLTRGQLVAGIVALVFDWWSLFVRLADPKHHREAITSRPLLLSAIAQRSQQTRQMKLTISSVHGARDRARQAYLRIAGFLERLCKSTEQSEPLQRWYPFSARRARHFLQGRRLQPPLRLSSA